MSIKGVQFISDPDGTKKAVVLDLTRHGRVEKTGRTFYHNILIRAAPVAAGRT